MAEFLRIEDAAKIDNPLQDFYITLLHVTMSKHRQFKYMGLNTVSKQIKPGKNFIAVRL